MVRAHLPRVGKTSALKILTGEIAIFSTCAGRMAFVALKPLTPEKVTTV